MKVNYILIFICKIDKNVICIVNGFRMWKFVFGDLICYKFVYEDIFFLIIWVEYWEVGW